ncbi:MAG: glycosyltransferase family 4 protein [Ectothiorhodospiraceae bacterium]|nr:glycosyltransferase family 4 protein [Ectothiorhodospiraceae bacterium]
MEKPNVCYFRGSFLNPFETQYIEKLTDDFEISTAYTKSHRFDVSSITLPKIEVGCLDYANNLLPRKMFGKTVPNFLKYFGYDEVLLNYQGMLEGLDILHMQEQSFYSSWQLAKNKSKYGYKIVTVQCEVNPYWYLHKPKIVERARYVRSQTDKFIARSERAKQALICENVPEEKISVIGHGVNTDIFKPRNKEPSLLKKHNIDEDRLIILSVGHLLWTKGIFSLVNAARLLAKHPEWLKLNPLFLIIGEGDERGELENRIKLYGLEKHFLLLGKRPYHELPAYHNLADIFTLPSISTKYILEQFGIALIESMASGIPVISTHCGAIDEVVGDAGVLVQPNDYYRLYIELLSLGTNPEERVRLGEAGRLRVNSLFTEIGISDKISKVYSDLL